MTSGTFSRLAKVIEAQDKILKKLEEHDRQVADVQRQLSKRCLIIHGPDVPPKKPRETEQQTLDTFVAIANEVYGILIEKLEVAACHRQGKVIL